MDSLSASLVNRAVAMSQSQFQQQVGYAVLRKAMNTEVAAAIGLLQAIPAVPSASETLGRNLNVFA